MIQNLFTVDTSDQAYTVLQEDSAYSAVLMTDDMDIVAESDFKNGIEPIYSYLNRTLAGYMKEDVSVSVNKDAQSLKELSNEINNSSYPYLKQAVDNQIKRENKEKELMSV